MIQQGKARQLVRRLYLAMGTDRAMAIKVTEGRRLYFLVKGIRVTEDLPLCFLFK